MSGPAARRSLPLPGPVAIFVVVLGVLLYAAFLSKGPWDSDYYWHVKTGELIANGQFPRTDPFSFTWFGMPWTLHEWLGELVLFRLVDGPRLHRRGARLRVDPRHLHGDPGLRAASLWAAHRCGRRSRPRSSALLVIPYATIRPQAVSWIMFALLTAGLLHLRPDRARWTLAARALFVAVGQPPRPVGCRCGRAGRVRR